MLLHPAGQAGSSWAAYQTSLCLLHKFNTNPVNLTAANLDPTVTKLVRALTAQSSSSQADLRLVVSLLRLLTALATKVAVWPTHSTSLVINAISGLVYYRPGRPTGPGPQPPERTRVFGGGATTIGSGQGFGGVMGAFGATGPSSKSNSTARSLSRSSSTSSLGRAWSDDSEDEGAKAADRG